MAKIIVGAAMLVAGIALMIYCGPMGAAAMMALYGAIASTGFSMVLGGIAQKLQGQHSPAIGIAVKQAASPWNVVYGRSRIGGVIAYLNTYARQNVALDLVVAHVGHYVARVGNAGRNGLPFGGLYLDGKEVLCDHYGNSAGGQLTDASGNTYSFDTGGGRGQGGQSWVFWNTRVGTPDQPAEYPLQNQQDPNWKPSCTLSGRAYSYLNLVWDQHRFRNASSIRVRHSKTCQHIADAEGRAASVVAYTPVRRSACPRGCVAELAQVIARSMPEPKN